jgi:hypothetical protein
MSALLPKADITERDWNVRFVPKADICNAAKERLFDHLIGDGKQWLGRFKAKRPGSLAVDDQLVLSWCWVGRLLAVKDAIDVASDATTALKSK